MLAFRLRMLMYGNCCETKWRVTLIVDSKQTPEFALLSLDETNKQEKTGHLAKKFL